MQTDYKLQNVNRPRQAADPAANPNGARRSAATGQVARQLASVTSSRLPGAAVVVLFLLLGIFLSAQAQTFVHPGIPFTTADLNQLKANSTTAPWSSGYAALAADFRSQLNYGRQGPFATVSRAPDVNNIAWRNDMVAIHNLAFMYVFTNNAAYAQKATDILDAWATTQTDFGGDEDFLDLGDYSSYLFPGADILKYTYPGWTAANTAHVSSYFHNVLWPVVDVPNPTRGHNQGAIQLKAALAIAASLDDATKWQQALASYRGDAGGGLANSLPNGEVGDTGRDEGHWFGQVEALSWSAEVAWKQGVDMYSELNNRLLATSELYTGYNTGAVTFSPFVPFGGTYAYYFGPSPVSGQRRQSYLYNIINGAYPLRKGIAAPYTDAFRNITNPTTESSPSFLYRKSADASTAAALPPIAHPSAASVTNLSNTDVGSVGLRGSASYTSGTWSVAGAGADIPVPALASPDAFNYAFQQVTGDAVMIAKVTSVGNTNPDARAGIMFRETFADNSRHVGIFLQPGGTANLTWRAATAFSKTNISWNNPPGGYLPHGGPVAPWWLKLERLGNRISAFHSADGVNWTCLGIVVSPLPNSVYVGLAVTSHNTSALNTSTFTDVSITSPSPAGAPVITSATAATTVANAPFSYAVTASNAPTGYSATGLPAGLGINATTGAISGTTAAVGTFYVTIGATNGSGTGTATLVLTVTNSVAPAVPTGVTLTNPGVNQVTVAWNAVANATSYSVKSALAPGGPYTTLITNVTGTSFTDANAFPGYNYYVVTALAGSLESAPSAEASILLSPNIPARPTIVSGNNQLTLSWPAATGAASYHVKRSPVSGGPYATIATNLTATSYVDNAVANGTLYYYVVSSVLASRESANSDEALGVPGSSTANWSATPTSNGWNLGANWDGGVVPTSPTILGFSSSATTTLTNDITGLQVARLTFNAGASAYTMAGNAIALGSDITNNSTSLQTLNMPLALDRPLLLNVAAGPVVLGGALSGSGGIVKRGLNSLTLSTANTYSGGTTIYDSNGGWPPSAPLLAGGVGTGTSGSPTSGALGTGPVTLSGGALMNNGAATLYNDITLQAGTKSYLYVNTSGSLTLAGRLLGSGTVESDVASTGGLHFTGDNSGFTGTYLSVNRSSASRIRFDNANAGSANANWVLNSTFVDSHGFTFGSATIHFGALSGTGYFRNDGAGGTVPIMSIGALNTNTTFAGFIIGTIGVTKVGTGELTFTGTSNYNGPTTVNSGTLLVSSPGSIGSAVQVNAGTFGGSGSSSGTLTVGTGAGAGATLAPGNHAVGTLTTGALTLKADATYLVEYNTTDGSADKVAASAVTLANPTLTFTQLNAGTLAAGTNITLLDNTGATAVTGTFNNLPELALVTIGGYAFRITYRGGTGNDVVLLDNRTAPALISSSLTAIGTVGQSFSYPITAVNSPTGFNATGLPAGLGVNTSTGVISGVPIVAGTFSVTLSATNANGTDSKTLTLTVYGNVVSGLIVASGDARNILDWDPLPVATSFNVKRATTAGGPYTIIGNTTSTRYTDSPVANGTSYYYVVSTLDAGGENPNSAEVAARPNLGQAAYYKFNEGSGTRGIDAWGGNHATLQPTATRSPGYDGTALQLDGTANSYATLPTGIVSGISNFTISTWVKMDAIATWMRVFDFGNSATQYMFLTVQAGTSGSQSIVRFGTKNGAAAEQAVSFNYTFPLNTWVHMAVTRAANTATLFLNGNQVATGPVTVAALGSTTLNYLGKSQFADPLLRGAIDEFRIYSRALTAAEIATTALPNLVVSNAQNLSGSYNNVTITGAATGGAGAATLTGGLTVAGSLTVQAGGLLNTGCQALSGSGDFVLQAGGELRICDAAGISSTGGTVGSILMTGTRTFSPDASYTYTGTAAQATGTGLPGRVRNLTVNNASGVTLSAPTSISQVLSLTNGNLNLATQGLTLLSDATNTAMVVNTNGVVNGMATVQRYIMPGTTSGAGYRHYSSPVQSTTVADLTTSGFTPVINPAYNTQGNSVTPFPTVYSYDESRLTVAALGFDQGFISPGAMTDVLTPGRGYTVNIPASETVDFVGTLTNGAVSRLALTRGSQSESGWQLLGNPYPSPLDWDAVGRTGIDGAVYVFHSSGQYAGTYSSYLAGSGGIGTNGGTNQLALGQGFFVRTSTGSTAGTVNFTNAARITTYANPVFNRTATTNTLVRLELRPATGSADEAVVYFTAGATPGVEAQFDAFKLSVGGAVLLASELAANQALSINGLPVLGTADVMVPLRVQASQPGAYSLHATELLNLPAGTVAYLRDAQTGTQTDLSQVAAYSFTLGAGASASGRFSLLLSRQGVLATSASQLNQQVQLFPNPAHGQVAIQLPAALSSQAVQATLLNALGQVVSTRQLAATADAVRTLDLAHVAQGVYTLQLQTSAGRITKRLIVE